MKYLALVRGVNVGGNALLRMSELKTCLAKAGFAEVRTYIQSGNVLFAAPKRATPGLARKIEAAIEKTFALQVGVTVFTGREWQEVVRSAPSWWGENPAWKHNLLALLPGTTTSEVLEALGQPEPRTERRAAGPSVIYQSISADAPDRKVSSKAYRRVTVRNRNTTMKLAEPLANAAGVDRSGNGRRAR